MNFKLKVLYRRRNKNSRGLARWGHYWDGGGVVAESERDARLALIDLYTRRGYKVLKIEPCCCNQITESHKHERCYP
jgi:RNA 3'-terminal phosphate cyclase